MPCILCAGGAGQVKMELEAKFAMALREERCPGVHGGIAGQQAG